MTLYAQWRVGTYTIALHSNFHRNDLWPTIGSAVFESTGTRTIGRSGLDSEPPISVTYGAAYPVLPIPTHAGWVFDHWYDGIEGEGHPENELPAGNPIPGTVSIYRSTTFYAQWNPKTFVATFDANGGSPNRTKNVQYYRAIGAFPATPTYVGRTFTGWFTKDNTKIETTTLYTIAGPTTYYAHWDLNKYIITFNANGGTIASSSYGASSTFSYGDIIYFNRITLNTPAGKVYDGWSNATSGNHRYGTTMTVTETRTVYARWRNVIYTVRYNGNGHTSGTTANSTHEYGVAKNLTANGFQKVHTVTFMANGGTTPAAQSATYSFAGWATSSGGSVAYGNRASVTNLTNVDGAIVDLYAKWNSSTVTLPGTARAGHTFNGWFTAQSGGTKAGIPGQTYTPASTMTLYAQWTIITYNVKYLPSSGVTGSEYNDTKKWGKNLTLRGATYYQSLYDQTGWSTSNGGAYAYALGGTYSANEAVTLYPTWARKKFTLTFNANGGSGGGSTTQEWGTAVAYPANPTRTNYIFNGWSPVIPGTMP